MNAKHLRIYKYFCVAIFCLICLGGSVRAMKAGLSCPDWPLCFGRFIPHYQPEVYFEFIHRVLAGLVSLLAVYLNIRVMKDKTIAKSVKWVVGGALVLLVGQIILGGLTVLLKLQNEIVTAHLAMGTGFFALSLWAYLTLVHSKNGNARNLNDNHGAHNAGSVSPSVGFSILLVAAVYFQILLGGRVASNYAGLVCLDFPTCNGSIIPTLSGLIGIQVLHRLGAYTLALIIFTYAGYILSRIDSLSMRRWAKVIAGLVVLQICIGVANVKLLTPPLITVAHLGTGVCILAVAVRLLREATWSRKLARATAREAAQPREATRNPAGATDARV